jgi:hypothetical protein
MKKYLLRMVWKQAGVVVAKALPYEQFFTMGSNYTTNNRIHINEFRI